MRNGRIAIPTPRRILLKIHKDLFIVDSKVSSIQKSYRLSNLEKSVIVLEDGRFFSHWGIDWKSIVREMVRAATRRKHGGASTIDMQFVRTATGYKERTLRRKIYEMTLATIIQFRYSKLQILRSYLGCAFFGSGLYGAESASYSIFGNSPDELEMEASAALAAMLVSPKPLKPTSKWDERIELRTKYALSRLYRFEQRFNQFESGKVG